MFAFLECGAKIMQIFHLPKVLVYFFDHTDVVSQQMLSSLPSEGIESTLCRCRERIGFEVAREQAVIALAGLRRSGCPHHGIGAFARLCQSGFVLDELHPKHDSPVGVRKGLVGYEITQGIGYQVLAVPYAIGSHLDGLHHMRVRADDVVHSLGQQPVGPLSLVSVG